MMECLPEGKASTNMVNFAALINSGYDVKLLTIPLK
jgi:hypothetical protein